MKTLAIISCMFLAGCGASGAAQVRAGARDAQQRFVNIAVIAEDLPESTPRTQIIAEAEAGQQCIEKVFTASEKTEDKTGWLAQVGDVLLVGLIAAVVVALVWAGLVIRLRIRDARLGTLAAKKDWTGLVASGRTMSSGFERAYRAQRPSDGEK